jgi:hypothetical protein
LPYSKSGGFYAVDIEDCIATKASNSPTTAVTNTRIRGVNPKNSIITSERGRLVDKKRLS